MCLKMIFYFKEQTFGMPENNNTKSYIYNILILYSIMLKKDKCKGQLKKLSLKLDFPYYHVTKILKAISA